MEGKEENENWKGKGYKNEGRAFFVLFYFILFIYLSIYFILLVTF